MHLYHWQIIFSKIEKYYPKTGNYISLSIIQILEKNGDYESPWEFIKMREYVSVKTVWEYQNKLKKSEKKFGSLKYFSYISIVIEWG